METLQIIELTEDNIPDGPVIAIGYQDECLVGYISKSENEEDGFICEDEHQILTNVSHYINLPKRGENFE